MTLFISCILCFIESHQHYSSTWLVVSGMSESPAILDLKRTLSNTCLHSTTTGMQSNTYSGLEDDAVRLCLCIFTILKKGKFKRKAK